MDKYLIDIFECIKSGDFKNIPFVPDESRWISVKLWYHKYSEIEQISHDKLLDIPLFFLSS